MADVSVCTTPQCAKVANYLLGNLSPNYTTIDPCVNFDQYACGGFPLRWPSVDAKETTDVLDDHTATLLPAILNGDFPTTSESTAEAVELFTNMKKIYTSCMDEAAIKRDGLTRLQGVVDEVVQRFPVADSEYMANTTYGPADYDAMANVTSYLAELGIRFLVEMTTVPNPVDRDVIIPLVFPQPLSFFGEGAIQQTAGYFQKVYRNQAAKDASLKLARGISNIWDQLEVVFGSMDSYDLVGINNIATLDEAVESSPGLVLDKRMEHLAPEGFKPDLINLGFPDYFVAVNKILAKTPKADLQAALVRETINGLSSFVDQNALESNGTKPNVRRTASGKSNKPLWPDKATPSPHSEHYRDVGRVSSGPRRKGKRQQDSSKLSSSCRSQVNRMYTYVLGKFYLDAAYTGEMRTFAREIVDDIKTSFGQTLDNTTWMDDATRTLAKEKASQIPAMIGYPDKNPDAVDAGSVLAFYAGFNVTDNLFETRLAWSRWDVARQWAPVGGPSNRSDHWYEEITVYTTTGVYVAQYNEIMFPAAMTQFPIFDVDSPSYFSMGAFGQIGGHELTHAFDNNGRHYDPNGAYKDWWSNETVAAFEKRAQCFVDQFETMPVVDYTGAPVTYPNGTAVRINGQRTLSENIADSGGISTAFGAWKLREQRQPAQGLPGMEGFTKEQIFFLSAAQTWCHKEPPENVRDQIEGDPHSPAFARIRGMMANTREFLEAFDCPVKEPTCELW